MSSSPLGTELDHPFRRFESRNSISLDKNVHFFEPHSPKTHRSDPLNLKIEKVLGPFSQVSPHLLSEIRDSKLHDLIYKLNFIFTIHLQVQIIYLVWRLIPLATTLQSITDRDLPLQVCSVITILVVTYCITSYTIMLPVSVTIITLPNLFVIHKIVYSIRRLRTSLNSRVVHWLSA
eukprot:TRINITY_DN1058_c0_g1_i2.p1 TRINITY_DN1058_c0_g1~~TRINITY_DN1058_c0_g1_i2.p1  ORF type:complete len:177 (-),score=6.91 TRINITY_DN1058_c0_g1_i2:31-561(-)